MPSSQVMHEWKAGRLHSGRGKKTASGRRKKGLIVKKRNQAIAIKMSMERKEKKARKKTRR
jgi:hypothetical protein